MNLFTRGNGSLFIVWRALAAHPTGNGTAFSGTGGFSRFVPASKITDAEGKAMASLGWYYVRPAYYGGDGGGGQWLSPEDFAEAGYTEYPQAVALPRPAAVTSGLDFAAALTALREGHDIKRVAWMGAALDGNPWQIAYLRIVDGSLRVMLNNAFQDVELETSDILATDWSIINVDGSMVVGVDHATPDTEGTAAVEYDMATEPPTVTIIKRSSTKGNGDATSV